MHHKLKTLPAYFEAVLSGDKPFEIRDDRDRGFQRGDTVTLMEYDPGSSTTFQRLTGRTIEKRITYVTAFEQKPGFVVFGIADLQGGEGEARMIPAVEAQLRVLAAQSDKAPG